MPTRHRFLLELGEEGLPAEDVQALASRSRRAAAAMRADGLDVRFLRAIYVPEDCRCFLLFEAESATAASDTATRAGIAAGAARPAIAI